MYDPIVDEVRRVREELIDRHGGLHGYIKHLQAMDRERARKAKQRAAMKLAVNGRKRRTRPARSRTSRAIKST
jgi:hypothetical protein